MKKKTQVELIFFWFKSFIHKKVLFEKTKDFNNNEPLQLK
jgi:hypothetical protein